MSTKEKLKTKAAQAGEELRESGRAALRSGALVRAGEWVIRLRLGAVLAGAEILGGFAPFGVALVGASGSGIGGFAALLGACFGYLSFHGLTRGLRYVAASILTYAVAFAFFDVRVYRKSWFMPLAAAAMSAVTGFVYLSEGGWLAADAVFFGTELLLTGSFVYFFRVAFSPWTEKGEAAGLTVKQLISQLLLAAAALIALANIEVYGGISLGRLAAALGVMCLSCQGGLGTGAVAGLAVGLAMDMAAGGPPYYSMTYAFAGLMAGVLAKRGKLAAALGYVLANGLAVLWTWNHGIRLSLLYEVFIASVLFMLLPARFFRWLGSLAVREGSGETGTRALAYLRKRLDGAAEAFRTVRESLDSSFKTPPNDNDAATVFDRTADRVCAKCALRNTCWQRDYVSTYNALNDGLPAMVERGRGEPGDFPEHFRSRCLRFSAFLAAANEELTALLCRREYRSRLRESRAAVAEQYAGLADILGAAAAEFGGELAPDPVKEKRLRQHLAALGVDGEAAVYYDRRGRLRAEVEGRGLAPLKEKEEGERLSKLLGVPLAPPAGERTGKGERLVLVQAEPMRALAGVAAVQKDGQTVSGDTGAWFKREDGRLFVLLCDGMGAGEAAGAESALAVRLLEQFLQAGVDTAAALKTVAAALGLRGEREGGFTTVDLLDVDLFTGEAAVYKYGAAPTYVRKGERVTRLVGTSLPAGLSAGETGSPDVARLRLEPGDWVLLVSDGVADGEDDAWLREKLAGAADSPRELCRAVLEGSGETAADDKTVLAVRLAARA